MPQYNGDHLRQRLRLIRETVGYSQSTLTKMMGLKSYETLYNMETKGKSKMLDRVANWAGSLGYTITAVQPANLDTVLRVDNLDAAQLAILNTTLDAMGV